MWLPRNPATPVMNIFIFAFLIGQSLGKDQPEINIMQDRWTAHNA